MCRTRVLGAGLRESYDNFTGYTLGYYGATHPPRTSDFTRTFVPTAGWVLEPGMVFMIHPNQYLPETGYLLCGEPVVITGTRAEPLTRRQAALAELR